VTGKQGHGVEVETDSLLGALEPTRVLRHALDALWGNLPTDMETDTVRTALYEIDERLRKAILADLRKGVLARDYFVISPINPMNPPDPEDMEKVAAALRTLNDLGLIIIP
jgi:hypothetical protein